MPTLGDISNTRQTFLAHARQSRPMALAGLFVSQRTGSHSLEFHVPHTNCFARSWFCVVHGPKPPLHRHNWLVLENFKTERLLIPCPRHISSRLSHSGEIWKYTTAPSIQKKTWRYSLHIDMLLSAVSVLFVAQPSSEVPEGLMNYPVCIFLGVCVYTAIRIKQRY
jgi:hypothetical protein